MIGYSRAEHGTGESCRLAAHALKAVHIPFGIINYWPSSARQEDLTWASKEIKEPLYNTNIFHINADQLMIGFKYKLLNPAIRENRYNIAMWHWELPEFPDEYGEGFSLVDEIWAPTEFITNAIRKKTSKPVLKIPHGIVQPSSTFVQLQRHELNLPEKAFLFLTMYDPNSSQLRKNPQAVIKAFQKAFSSEDKSVGLVVKINKNEMDIADEMNVLKSLIGHYNNIHILNYTMSRKAMNALFQQSDCFVSLHRSEGFGLSLAEAMVLGKPVIGTGWSGNMEFMNRENSCTVGYTLTPVGKDWGPYKAEQLWADPDLEEAAYYMKKLVAEPVWRSEIAEIGKRTILEHYSPMSTGNLIKQRLAELKLY